MLGALPAQTEAPEMQEVRPMEQGVLAVKEIKTLSATPLGISVGA